MRRSKFLSAVFGAVALVLSVASAQAQDTYAAHNEQNTRINRWAVCRDVSGRMGNNPVMIPTRTPNEWASTDTSFLGSGAQGTAVQPCMAREIVPPAGTYCAAHPGAAMPITNSTSQDEDNGTPGGSITISRTGKFVIMTKWTYKIFSYLYLSGLASSDPLTIQQATYRMRNADTGFNIDSRFANFSPDDTQVVVTSPIRMSWGGYPSGSVTASVYGIAKNSRGRYNVSWQAGVYIGNNWGSTRQRRGGRYDYVGFTLGGKLFYTYKDFHNVWDSRKKVWNSVTDSISVLEFSPTGSGYSLSQQFSIPAKSTNLQISDDGSAFFAYDEQTGKSNTYTRDPATQRFSLAQSSGGSLAPRVMAPGGTVALGYKTGTPNYVRGSFGRKIPVESFNGQVAVYTKQFPDDPTWTLQAQKKNFYYQIGEETPRLTTDGSKFTQMDLANNLWFQLPSFALSGPTSTGRGWVQTSYPLFFNGSSSHTSGGCGGNCGSQMTTYTSRYTTFCP